MADLPEAPIAMIEALKVTTEKVAGDISPLIETITEEGLTDEQLAWINRFNDATEGLYTALDGLFKLVNQAHGGNFDPDLGDDNGPADEELEPTLALDHNQHAILKYIYENPLSRLEVMRNNLPEVANLSGPDFTIMREEIMDTLSKNGVALTFETEGKARGTKYFVEVSEGYEKLHNILYPPEPVEEDGPLPADDQPVELKDGAVVIIAGEPTSQPEQASISETQPTLSLVPQLPTQIAMDEYPEFLPSSTELVPDEALVQFITARGSVHMSKIVQEVCGVNRLDPIDFHKLSRQLNRLMGEGHFISPARSMFAVEGYEEPAEPMRKSKQASGVPLSDPEFDKMLKAAHIGTPGPFRSRNRGRRAK